MTSEKTKVAVRSLYKIFGPEPLAALEQIHNGMNKSDLLEQHGHVLGLRDINVDMVEGEITVIMGLSGSGKSTLIRHLNRLIEPTAGEILLDGVDVMSFTEDEAKKPAPIENVHGIPEVRSAPASNRPAECRLGAAHAWRSR